MSDNATYPAFPTENTYDREIGLTKREYFAGQIIGGAMLASAMPASEYLYDDVAKHAVRMADALLAALEEKE